MSEIPNPHQLSLFSSTSAFVQPPGPTPDELAARHVELHSLPVGRAVTSQTRRLARIAELIEDAMAATTDTDLYPILEEALEEARGA